MVLRYSRVVYCSPPKVVFYTTLHLLGILHLSEHLKMDAFRYKNEASVA